VTPTPDHTLPSADARRGGGGPAAGIPDEAPSTNGALSDARGAERNRLLRAIPDDEYARLQPYLEPFQLEPMQILTEPGERIEHVYFPQTGIVSVLRRMRDGTLIEVITIGREGMAGIAVTLGDPESSLVISGQVPGASGRVDAEAFTDLLPNLPRLEELLRRYALTVFEQTSQSLACNSLHSIEQRCARWLLMTHDRVDGDEFILTHEILAQMLAVRRAGVTEAAGALQRAGVISYTRGRITIRDRAGLERFACECYGAVRDQFDRLLGDRAIERG
jgi:CRP-like cAMP-binding protein